MITRKEKVVNLACVIKNAIQETQPQVACCGHRVSEQGEQFFLCPRYDGEFDLMRLAEALLDRT